MKRKKRNRQSGWIVPYLHMIGAEAGAADQPEEEREAFAILALSRLARKAFNRIKDQNYIALYEGEGYDVPNLYAEAYCEGFEAGMKAAGVIIEQTEGGADGK